MNEQAYMVDEWIIFFVSPFLLEVDYFILIGTTTPTDRAMCVAGWLGIPLTPLGNCHFTLVAGAGQLAVGLELLGTSTRSCTTCFTRV